MWADIYHTPRKDSIDCLNKVLLINFGDKDASKSVPWHVAESCETVVNINLDASRSHLTVNICA